MYDFAYNKIKLQQSIKALTAQKLLNPAIEINEETVRAEYIKRAGLVLSIEEIEEKAAEFIEAPKPVTRRRRK